MKQQSASTGRLLILGGTAEAAALARSALESFGHRLRVTTALAGRTEEPSPIPGLVRIGGFGGADGLARYLEREAIELLIDATHPFAEEISRHARLAADRAGIPRLILDRAPWPRHPLDRWIEVETMAGAAMAVARLGHRPFITTGTRGLDAFAEIENVHFLVRLISAPKTSLPLRSYDVLLARGPFNLPGERELIRQRRIDIVVTKASGGTATEPKLIAARELGLPVVLLRRPSAEQGVRVENLGAALDWIEEHLGRRMKLSGKVVVEP